MHDFMGFVGIEKAEEFRIVTRAHVIAWRKSLEERELVVGQDSNAPDDWERLSELESSYREAFDNEYSSSTYSRSRHAGERDRKMDALANVPARDERLPDQLLDLETTRQTKTSSKHLGSVALLLRAKS